jgi:hypothetical protein
MEQIDEEGNILVAMTRDRIVIGCHVEDDEEASCECVDCEWALCQMRGQVA